VATTDLNGAQTCSSTTGLDVESADEAQARIARIEQRMADAEALREAAAQQAADVPARKIRKVSYASYEAALAAGREIGASRADDAALMALFCEGPLQTLVGAVSPELVWDGAQRQGLTTRELGRLANSDVMAVSDLQWIDDTPTAPLPAPAVEALARLERAFVPMPLHIVRAVTRFEIATARYDELDARPASTLSPVEVDAFLAARQTVADAFGVLAEAGRLDLIEPAEAATRYRQASAHCARLAAQDDIDGCWVAQDEMRMCRCQLEQAGRLDLIEVA